MRVLTFKRGAHPPDSKAATSGQSIQVITPAPGAEMIFPMVQHLGAPCEPVVAKGDQVFVGQKIGDSKGYVSSPVHSSVSGIVKEIRKTLTPGGIECPAVVVVNDGNDQKHPSLDNLPDYHSLSKDELLRRVREGGIVGLGGAGFPTHVKLSPPQGKTIDTFIINAAECEPYLTTDHRVMLEETEELIGGLEVMQMIFPSALFIIAIETNKPDAIQKLTDRCRSMANVEVAGLVPKYPQGAEKQLIYACTGREVPSGGLPADVGCIVDNVDTIIAVKHAVVDGLPLMQRVITLSGSAVKKPGNYKARLGMTYAALIEATGGFASEPYKMISGGPMMGVAMFSLDVPVIKTSSALLCLTEKEGRLPAEQNCIRCGRCVEGCPMALMPLELNQYVLHGETELFEKQNGLDCIECGSCSFVCPAKRHLVQSIRTAKRDLLAAKRKQAAGGAK